MIRHGRKRGRPVPGALSGVEIEVRHYAAQEIARRVGEALARPESLPPLPARLRRGGAHRRAEERPRSDTYGALIGLPARRVDVLPSPSTGPAVLFPNPDAALREVST